MPFYMLWSSNFADGVEVDKAHNMWINVSKTYKRNDFMKHSDGSNDGM